jgi:hypothetical protein
MLASTADTRFTLVSRRGPSTLHFRMELKSRGRENVHETRVREESETARPRNVARQSTTVNVKQYAYRK